MLHYLASVACFFFIYFVAINIIEGPTQLPAHLRRDRRNTRPRPLPPMENATGAEPPGGRSPTA
jgi:hypothetical protein